MKKFNIMLILMTLFIFSSPLMSESLDYLGNVAPSEIAEIPAYETNTDPTMDNVAVEVEEVESLVSQWKAVILMIKGGGFSLGLLFFTIMPLLLVSIMTLGVVLVTLLRFLTLVTPEYIDKKIDIIEDWITKYIIKIPITILSNIKNLKKKE